MNVLISATLLISAACMMDFARTLESTQVVTVRGATIGEVVPEAIIVEEQIYREEGFPDPRYERIYRVQTGNQRVELGRYADEAANGMRVPPRMVGSWLVVMSGAHIFFWQPDADVRHFYPYVADTWVEYAQERQLNGHYDYAATAVQIHGADWRITYTCAACLARQPAEIHFVSTDGGRRFQIE